MAEQQSTQSPDRRSPIRTTIVLAFDESDMIVADLREFVASLDGLDDSHPVGLWFEEGEWHSPRGIEVIR